MIHNISTSKYFNCDILSKNRTRELVDVGFVEEVENVSNFKYAPSSSCSCMKIILNISFEFLLRYTCKIDSVGKAHSYEHIFILYCTSDRQVTNLTGLLRSNNN